MSSPTPAGTARLGLVLTACCAGQFMVVLDASVVNVALPSISSVLHFDPANLQWVINAYTIVFAGFLLLGGRLADLFGRRRAFLVGIVVFTLASLVGGLAYDPVTLMAARAVQGLGSAIMAPATLTILGTTFTDSAARTRAFGMWGAVAAGGGAVGVLAGGVIVEWLSWRWILLVNVPIGVALFALTAATVTELKKAEKGSKINVTGAAAVTIGLVALVYGIAESQSLGWGSWQVVTGLVVAAVALTFFVLDQAKLATNPLVPLSIFRNRSLSGANVVAFTSSAALYTTFYFFTLFTQDVLGYTPLYTGLAYLPLACGIFLGGRVIAPSMIGRSGPRRVLIIGLVSSAIALSWLSTSSVDSTFFADLFGPMLLLGLGQGLISASSAIAATAGLPSSQAGLGSGLINVNRQLGGAIGLAVLVAIANSRTGALLDGRSGPAELVREATTSGYATAFLVSAVVVVVGIGAALMVPGPKREEKSEDIAEPAVTSGKG